MPARDRGRPQKRLVWNIVAKWYEGKKCVFCEKPIAPVHHMDRTPALLGPDFHTKEWKQVAPEKLPEVFPTNQPVCWICHVAEIFRRLHPELETDRPGDVDTRSKTRAPTKVAGSDLA